MSAHSSEPPSHAPASTDSTVAHKNSSRKPRLLIGALGVPVVAVVAAYAVSRIRFAQLDNWIWGLSLITLTIALHATGVAFMVSALHNIRVRLESRGLRLLHVFAIVIGAITTMGLLLAALHMVEAALWAAAYLWLGALGSPEAAILYSVDTMATRGASGINLQPDWQMMGALEGANGMLLFGISTAFIFTVMQFYYQHLALGVQQAVRPKPNRPQPGRSGSAAAG
jgi:hypothetical protein